MATSKIGKIKLKLPLKSLKLKSKSERIEVGNFEVEIKLDNAEKWRWHFKSTYNGKIIDASSQGFASKEGCKRNLALLGRDIEQYLKNN